MKIRIKFSKKTPVKYLGHLDIMRFFQKCLNRAHVRMVYSIGFNPHQKISFALPLGVGITSSGEYFDAEVEDGQDLSKMKDHLNAQSGIGFEVTDIRKILPDGEKAMAAVRSAEYRVTFPDQMTGELSAMVEKVLAQEQILMNKKTKKGEKETDIRSGILSLDVQENFAIMRLTAGSVNNLKPEHVAQAMLELSGFSYERSEIQIQRTELFAEDFVPLIEYQTEGAHS